MERSQTSKKYGSLGHYSARLLSPPDYYPINHIIIDSEPMVLCVIANGFIWIVHPLICNSTVTMQLDDILNHRIFLYVFLKFSKLGNAS